MPSSAHSSAPSKQISAQPTFVSSRSPTSTPSSTLFTAPSNIPTSAHSGIPSKQSSTRPTFVPSSSPTITPSSAPSVAPSKKEITRPTFVPSRFSWYPSAYDRSPTTIHRVARVLLPPNADCHAVERFTKNYGYWNTVYLRFK